jgi:hypothetical protein
MMTIESSGTGNTCTSPIGRASYLPAEPQIVMLDRA